MDSFKEGKRIPSCQLLVKCDSEQLFDLEPQSVSLKGAKEPYNVFTISVSGKALHDHNSTMHACILCNYSALFYNTAGSSKLGKEESNIKPNHSGECYA